MRDGGVGSRQGAALTAPGLAARTAAGGCAPAPSTGAECAGAPRRCLCAAFPSARAVLTGGSHKNTPASVSMGNKYPASIY